MICFLCFIFTLNVFGQLIKEEQPKLCTNHPVNKGKYKMLSIGDGIELQIDIKIDSKYRTDKNYTVIAKEFKEKYCQATQLRITYFESKKQWQILNPLKLEATPLAIYYFGKDTNKGGRIKIYTVINGKVETRELKLE